MKIGVSMAISTTSAPVTELARKAEELGYESMWMPEHSVIPVNVATRYQGSEDGSIPDYMTYMPDPFLCLAQASAVTQRINLGTGVSLIPEHNPLVLAKEVATLDHFSGGRFIFGIGAGWLREESQIMGGDFDHRWGQTRESIQAMKELWTQDEAEYHGKFYDFPAVRSYPKPASKPHPPVLIGSVSSKVFRRVVGWADGWMPTRVDPEQLKKGRATLDKLATAAGRDPRSIEVTAYGQPADPDVMKAFEDAGADRVIVRLGNTSGQGAFDELERMAEQVLGR